MKELRASAVAHPNIALAKYWGKRAGEGNYPAVPSLSVTLAGMETRTSVSFEANLTRDRLILGEVEQEDRPLERVVALLDRVRELSGVRRFAEVSSANDFPTASGLASSSSGFAALAFAALAAAGVAPESAEGRERTSDLARRSSASAARSVYGGFVELDAGVDPGDPSRVLAACTVAAPPRFEEELRVLVAVVGEAAKTVSSTDGMLRTAERSLYYPAWLDKAPVLFRSLRAAVGQGDFEAVGKLAEESALAMHASAIAAGVIYWNATTLELIAAVRALRQRGTAVYFTIDAGAHVKVVTLASESALVATWLASVPGVLRVLETRPGPGAHLVTVRERTADLERSEA